MHEILRAAFQKTLGVRMASLSFQKQNLETSMEIKRIGFLKVFWKAIEARKSEDTD